MRDLVAQGLILYIPLQLWLFAVGWPLFRGRTAERLRPVAERLVWPLFIATCATGAAIGVLSYLDRQERYAECVAFRMTFECAAIVYGQGRI